MDENTLVSVIIVNYNGKNHLEKCLESLMKINYNNYQVILVDNNSSDGSIQFVEKFYPSIRLIKLKKNFGFAKPNNIAAHEAEGDILLFLNNDTIVDPNFITEMIKVIKKDPKIAICQSLLLRSNGEVDSSGDFVDFLGRAYSSKEIPKDVKNILCARGASMMVRKGLFSELGCFDEDFFVSFEDVDIGWKAWIWGYKVVCVPKSIVYHAGGQTVKKLSSFIQYHGVKNTITIRLVNFEIGIAISSIVKFFVFLIMKKSVGATIMTYDKELSTLPSFSVIIRGVGWVLKNLGSIIKKHKYVKSKRVRSTKELINLGLITR